MSITCPSCQATYRIDLGTLGGGRKVRCARCRAEWFAPAEPEPRIDLKPIPSLDEAEAIDAIEAGDAHDEIGAVDAVILPPAKEAASKPWLRGRADRPRSRPRDRSARPAKAWRSLSKLRPAALAAACGLAAIGGLIGERVRIVRAAPSLASLYAAIGMPVNVRGLSISGVRSVEEIEGGTPLLLVTGAVENVSADLLDVPRLRLAVTGGGERELYAWTTVAARAKLAPGESAPFRARLASPPADGRGIAVRFLARRDLASNAGR